MSHWTSVLGEGAIITRNVSAFYPSPGGASFGIQRSLLALTANSVEVIGSVPDGGQVSQEDRGMLFLTRQENRWVLSLQLS